MGKRLTAALLCAFLILIPSCSLETFLGNLGNNVLGSPGEYTDAVAGKADSAGSATLEGAGLPSELKGLVSGVDKVLPTLEDGEKTELVADIVNATRNPEGKNAFTSAMSQPVEDAYTIDGAKGTATLIKEVFEKFDTSGMDQKTKDLFSAVSEGLGSISSGSSVTRGDVAFLQITQSFFVSATDKIITIEGSEVVPKPDVDASAVLSKMLGEANSFAIAMDYLIPSTSLSDTGLSIGSFLEAFSGGGSSGDAGNESGTGEV